MLIDVHCHLQDEAFAKDLEPVIQRAKDAGVKAIIISTQSFSEIEKSLRIIERYPAYIYLTVGCSPLLFDKTEIEKIQGFIRGNRDRIVGIGEVGLDYYWEKTKRELQVELFKEWIALALEVNLPIICHSRSAGKQTIELLLSNPTGRVVTHAFDEKKDWAKMKEEAGFKFSIPTSIVHSRQKQKLVGLLDINSIMLETDSPVLAPLVGERNEPLNLKYALEKVCEIKRLSYEKAEEIILQTTLNFFNTPANHK
ncbi:TatD family hydrolase [bacterium]|nr:TatD family hydrolase [bacterium]